MILSVQDEEGHALSPGSRWSSHSGTRIVMRLIPRSQDILSARYFCCFEHPTYSSIWREVSQQIWAWFLEHSCSLFGARFGKLWPGPLLLYQGIPSVTPGTIQVITDCSSLCFLVRGSFRQRNLSIVRFQNSPNWFRELLTTFPKVNLFRYLQI